MKLKLTEKISDLLPFYDEMHDKNISMESMVERIKQHRNNFLSETDWTQLNDSPLSMEKQIEYRTWREQLRNFFEISYTSPEEMAKKFKELVNRKPN